MPKKSLFVYLLSLCLLASCDKAERGVTSTIIVNAIIHNGSGSEPFPGAVRFDGDRIIEIGEFVPLQGETVIDAGGLVLAPGFIDTHSHQDSGMATHRHMPAALSQGITTLVRGADGIADIGDELRSIPLNAFNAAFAAAPAAVNIASFAPHNSIRRQVMGTDSKRPATAAEIEAMAALVEADMHAGALGLATGLEYEPGIYSETEEVISLARVAARYGGRYMSHLRDEDEFFLQAVDEIIRIGREADLPVKISHIKVADREFFGSSERVLGILNDARADGVDISADIYPYQHWASNLSVLFPDRDFTRPETAEYTFAHTGAPDEIMLARFLPNPDFQGLTVAEIAERTGKEPVALLLELAQAADDYTAKTGTEATSIIVKGMHEDDIAAFMQWEFTNICSDGKHYGEHPRGHGSFPRVLRYYVREQGVLELPEAIYKMTALPAASMGFEKRGRIRTGYYADLVLFDPATIEDTATMENPKALATGVAKVWVNGVLAFDAGAPTMQYPGRTLQLNGE